MAEFPNMGQIRPDIAPELRHSPVGRYTILYRTVTHGVQIVRVLFAGRQLSELI